MTQISIPPQRKCPICGNAFAPNRPNHIYCNNGGNKCRNYANNKKATDFRKAIDPVKTILEKNRKGLMRLLKNKKEQTFSKDFLAGAGIDLRYFTHVVKNSNGTTGSQIYDVGVIQLANNQIKIYKNG
jgi:hypothetical protein